jgi:hypothetical protein
MIEFPPDLAANPLLSTWFAIDADGVVTLRTGKVELAQCAVSAIAAMVAAELGISPELLRVVAGDTRSGPDEGLTASSISIEQGGRAARWRQRRPGFFLWRQPPESSTATRATCRSTRGISRARAPISARPMANFAATLRSIGP